MPENVNKLPKSKNQVVVIIPKIVWVTVACYVLQACYAIVRINVVKGDVCGTQADETMKGLCSYVRICK